MPLQRTNVEHYRYDPLGSRQHQQQQQQSQQQRQEGRRGPWSPQEDKLLKDLVEQHGAGNWVAIQNGIVSRTAKQCRERWHQNLDPKLNHDPITPEEGAQIDQLVEKMGKRWADIARHLKGRSDNAVKNWWNGGENRRRREQARVDTNFGYSRPIHHHHHHYPESPATQYWQPSPPQAWPREQVFHQPPPPITSLTLAPILTHPHEEQRQRSTIPPPISIPIHGVPRDMASPAVSLPSMTDASSPRSIRRESFQVNTPTVYQTTFGSELMIRSRSDDSSRSEGHLAVRPDISTSKSYNDTVGTQSPVTRLPPLRSFLSEPVPRELGHLINSSPNNRSPIDHGLRLPALSNINRSY